MRNTKTAGRLLRPDAAERARDALAIARREGVSLSAAARRVRSDPRTVLRHAGGWGFRKQGGRYQATKFDRNPREVALLQPDGPRYVTVRDSRTATALSEQSNAVQLYLDQHGDETGLSKLKGRAVQIDGVRYDLYLSPAQIDRLAMGSELHYELYRR